MLQSFAALLSALKRSAELFLWSNKIIFSFVSS